MSIHYSSPSNKEALIQRDFVYGLRICNLYYGSSLYEPLLEALHAWHGSVNTTYYQQ